MAPGSLQRPLPPSPALGPQQCACKSLKEHRLSGHRLAGSQGWCSGSCSSQTGGRKVLLIPWEKAPWQAEKRCCLHPALPQGHGTPSPRSARQALRPSVLPTPPEAWVRIPAGPFQEGIGSLALFLSNAWRNCEGKRVGGTWAPLVPDFSGSCGPLDIPDSGGKSSRRDCQAQGSQLLLLLLMPSAPHHPPLPPMPAHTHRASLLPLRLLVLLAPHRNR